MIITNTKTQPRRWRCPICKKKAHTLVVDPILQDIIKEFQPKALSDVTFFNDGNYKVTEEELELEDDYDSDVDRNVKITGPLICLDDDEEVGKERVYEQHVPTIPQTIQRVVPNACFGFEPNPFEVPEEVAKKSDIGRILETISKPVPSGLVNL